MKQQRLSLVVAAGALAAALAAGSLIADEAGDGRTKLRLVLDRDGANDQLVVDDLGVMEVGESRTFSTEAGKPVTVTRDESGWDLDVDGKKLRVGAGGEGGGDVMLWKQRRVDGEAAEGKTLVMVTSEREGDAPVRIVRRVGGPGEGHAFAFGTAPMGLSDLLISRLESNQKFLALDEATRATVLEAIRESAPGPHGVFVGEAGDEGEPGDRVIVLDLDEKPIDEGE